jgi:hypothetical protein
MTLTGWLLEQIAEDEAVARRGEGAIVFRDADFGDVDFRSGSDESVLRVSQRHLVEMHGSPLALLEGIARWLPARVLAECEAKRAILNFHAASTDHGDRYDPYCVGCWAECGEDGAPSYPCRTVRILTLPYAERPGYQNEWRA